MRSNGRRIDEATTENPGGRGAGLVALLRRAWLIVGLEAGMDAAATVTRIRDGVRLRGANLWILVCAAIIASIGLNTSSAAVIIGAMLISPLMGPILGIGLGVAIYDRVMLARALRSFGAAVVVSLGTSIVYFFVSPLEQPTTELLARTSPTLLDAGVAFFGGVAGIVAGSRRSVGTALPGVAIATALMPPLCTAGYGIASASWSYALGALYLFFLNAVLISVATYVVVRFLRIPHVAFVEKLAERRLRHWIAALSIAALVPSVFIFADVLKDIRRRTIAQDFVRTELETNGRKALSWSLDERDSVAMLDVYLAGDRIDSAGLVALSRKLDAVGLSGTRLRIVPLSLPEQLKAHVDENELLEMLRDERLQQQFARSIVVAQPPAPPPPDTVPVARIRAEIAVLFPAVTSLDYAAQPAADSIPPIHLFIVGRERGRGTRTRATELATMAEFLRLRVGRDSVRVVEAVPEPG